jgi:hypothetical protein
VQSKEQQISSGCRCGLITNADTKHDPKYIDNNIFSQYKGTILIKQTYNNLTGYIIAGGTPLGNNETAKTPVARTCLPH